ncbi:unnamed protein product [Effrenium voratum]|uniref:Uncharacterized protein n=1 Tax=Effrenium voratum TaxID=2562239 RepID=A0AA36IH32_9DINO|nr:unnamed protein product [Effrenium voratum]CAJ1387666.1 unnamed protein product [Effrenium voratum]
MGPEFSVPPAILAVMERWARLQPLAALPVAVWKRLDLASLYKLLLAECSSRDRKALQLTRDPGDVLWADDCLELTLGAAAALLDVDPRARRRPKSCSSACTARGSCWKIWRGRPKSCVSGGARQEPAWRCGRMAWKSWRYATWTGAASALFGHSCD